MIKSDQPEGAQLKELNNRISGHELRETQLNSDLREQNQLIDALRLAEERSAMLAAIVSSSDDAILSKDLNGLVMSWNLAAERIFGYAADEMIGESMTKLIPQDRMDEETQILNRLRAGERLDHFVTRRMTKSGEIIDVSLTISPVKDNSGDIIGISKIARDITSQIQAEQKSAILSAIIASTDDAIISKNFNSIITSWNNAAEHIFGYTAEEMIGESILKLIPMDRQEEEPEIIDKLKKGERVEHFETKRLTKQGTLIDVSLTISPVLDLSGRIIGVSKIARDITDKKLQERRKNDFIAIVSHELKTPLTSIRSYLQMALMGGKHEVDKFTENLLRRAESQTRKMTSMIHDFLNLSRLEEGKMSLNLSHFSLSELIDEVVSEVVVLAPGHKIDYERSSGVSVYGDREKLSQVLVNLLGNAIKYSNEGTVVKLHCAVKNGLATVSVHDQGIGISSADQARLFERFYRVQDDKRKNISGFGIGLYLVREILKLHGSKIMVQSEQGIGSTFSFALPYT
ncbi:PAS domain S-box protein [Pedobacter steynii]